MSEICSICGKEELVKKSVEQSFIYKGMELKYQQSGLWCDACNEAILNSEEMAITEKILSEFRSKVDG